MAEPETGTELLSGVLRQTEAVILGVAPSQRRDPTPCADYDVGRLVDHLVGWARSFAARLSGEEAEGDPGAYRAGDEPAAEFHAAAQAMLAAYRADTEASRQLPLGILVPEFLTHGWELARATGQAMSVDPAAAELGLSTMRTMLSPDFRGPGKSFGPEVEVDPSAPAIDRLVAFAGRRPDWRPSS